mmetsp:Transcript_17982/g.13005  ORF Transcript_17982/g.13005 Transcript_17982/m.13005 type:complete len:89 (+) Transcript_17982:409-675(+)
MSPDNYHYKSKIFNTDLESLEEQYFSLGEDLVAGSHVKVNLIGKVGLQSSDQKYYIALSYVGVSGMLMDRITNREFRELVEIGTALKI